MKEIKRYDIIAYGDGWAYYDEEIINDGEWVKYLDHKAEVETLEQKILFGEASYQILEGKIETMQKIIDELEAEKVALRNCMNCKIKDECSANYNILRECDEYSSWK